MKVESINAHNQLTSASQDQSADRMSQQKHASGAAQEAARGENGKVAPEEVLDQIKALTEGGTYSVRFEANKETEEMVVKIVDPENGETIRQIPPEELLGVNKRLKDLRAVMLDTKG